MKEYFHAVSEYLTFKINMVLFRLDMTSQCSHQWLRNLGYMMLCAFHRVFVDSDFIGAHLSFAHLSGHQILNTLTARANLRTGQLD